MCTPPLASPSSCQGSVFIGGLGVKVRKVFPCLPEVWGPCHQDGLVGIREVTSDGPLSSEAIPELVNAGESSATGRTICITGPMGVWEHLLEVLEKGEDT